MAAQPAAIPGELRGCGWLLWRGVNDPVASMTLCCVVADCGARDAAIHGDCTDRDA